ncbi:MAG: serine/threonine-protein kinase [Planctomycetota bacterium]|jgi:serine/threonine-protein kinase
MTGTQQIAGYRILSMIGEGAASLLYAVQDPKSKQVYALKHVVKATDRDHRFLEQVEAEWVLGQRLDHPNIRQVVKLIKHRKMFKVVAVSLLMELVDGTALDKRRPKNHAEAVEIFTQLGRGIAHMHGRGLVHADMKPHNVLLTDQGVVKIIDLGQACPTGTVKKRIQGTPGYMAPEQAHRQAITPKTDIYNFGATMYSMLVGEVIPTALPPKDESGSLFSGALDAEQVAAPKPPDQIDPTVHPLLSKQILDCVQIHPDARPESMDVVVNRLELIAGLLQNPPDRATSAKA